LGIPAVRLQFAVDDLQERGLAGAVGPDQRHVPARVDHPFDTVEQTAFADGIMQVADLYHEGLSVAFIAASCSLCRPGQPGL
jgi:hypothetical protein